MTPGNAGVWVPPKVLLQLPLLPSPLLLLRLRGEVPPEAERQDAVPGVPRFRRGSGRGVRLPRGGGLPEDPLDQEGASLRAGPAFGRTARGRGPEPGDAVAPETGSVPEGARAEASVSAVAGLRGLFCPCGPSFGGLPALLLQAWGGAARTLTRSRFPFQKLQVAPGLSRVGVHFACVEVPNPRVV